MQPNVVTTRVIKMSRGAMLYLLLALLVVACLTVGVSPASAADDAAASTLDEQPAVNAFMRG